MFLYPLRLSLLVLALAAPAAASEILPGPYHGRVERIVDGDTLAVRVGVWLQLEVSVLVRLRGIDAPELRGRCALESLAGRRAAEALAGLVRGGTVTLRRIEGDKYFGRVLADVAVAETDLAAALLSGGFARPYEGGTRGPWCAAIGAAPARGALAQAAAR